MGHEVAGIVEQWSIGGTIDRTPEIEHPEFLKLSRGHGAIIPQTRASRQWKYDGKRNRLHVNR